MVSPETLRLTTSPIWRTFARAQFTSGIDCLRDAGCYAVSAAGYQRPPIMHHCEETLANNNLAKTESRTWNSESSPAENGDLTSRFVFVSFSFCSQNSWWGSEASTELRGAASCRLLAVAVTALFDSNRLARFIESWIRVGGADTGGELSSRGDAQHTVSAINHTQSAVWRDFPRRQRYCWSVRVVSHESGQL